MTFEEIEKWLHEVDKEIESMRNEVKDLDKRLDKLIDQTLKNN